MEVSSVSAFHDALQYIPGGVNSPVRAYKGVESTPIFLQSGSGSHVKDIENRRYIDYVAGYGPLILGHAHPIIIKTITQAARDGLCFGAPTLNETRFAKAICDAIPSIEKVRLVSSGTEAVMSAIRLARAYTGRDQVLTFEGCYHGHADYLLSHAGSGAATLSIPTSPGVPERFVRDTVHATYNDIDSVTRLIDTHRDTIACIIVEPVAGNMGVVPPQPNFLKTLREITTHHGIVLIFDEVITGFRLCYGGAQNLYGVTPDLTTLGKIIGGGMPIGAYGGRGDIMSMIAPQGEVYQAGTLAGNPISVAVGLKTLDLLKTTDPYPRLMRYGERLATGISTRFQERRIPVTVNQVGSMVSLFFADHPVQNFTEAQSSDPKRFKQFFHELVQQGVLLPPSPFETWFLSTAHQDTDIEQTLKAVSAFCGNI